MMIPQIARRLIEDFGKKAKLLYDPYCGTGTSLVDANLKGINAIGTDINQLACLISKTKTTRLDLNKLKHVIHEFENFSFIKSFKNFENLNVTIPMSQILIIGFLKVHKLNLV